MAIAAIHITHASSGYNYKLGHDYEGLITEFNGLECVCCKVVSNTAFLVTHSKLSLFLFITIILIILIQFPTVACAHVCAVIHIAVGAIESERTVQNQVGF